MSGQATRSAADSRSRRSRREASLRYAVRPGGRMADDRMKDRDDQVAARPAGKRGTAGHQGTAGRAGTTGATGTAGSGGGATEAADVAGGRPHVATAHGRSAQ